MRFREINFCFSRVLAAVSSICLISMLAAAQDLPERIRGYRVHQENIIVASTNGVPNSDAFVTIGEPKLNDVSLTGISFALSAELKAVDQSGRVDFLTFYDFKVNGIPVTIDEYNAPFSFRKGQPISLPEPANIFLPIPRLLQAGWAETLDSKDIWVVTGRVFVFGKFRKMGFNFKRVVPVDIEVQIKNPLRGR